MPHYVTFSQEKYLASTSFYKDIAVPETKYSHEMPQNWQVIDWLLDTQHIFVEIFKQRGINGHGYNFMIVPVTSGENNSTPVINEEGYKTPHAAESAAFDYLFKISK